MSAIYEMTRGLMALRLECPASVVDDLTKRINAAIDAASAAAYRAGLEAAKEAAFRAMATSIFNQAVIQAIEAVAHPDSAEGGDADGAMSR